MPLLLLPVVNAASYMGQAVGIYLDCLKALCQDGVVQRWLPVRVVHAYAFNLATPQQGFELIRLPRSSQFKDPVHRACRSTSIVDDAEHMPNTMSEVAWSTYPGAH